ncbi:hypothetical protein PVL29_006333 [Vitis rotundifolia]|uniref:Transposase MuDR plant domain-containing protein n=1 Tax=Vitis rotundifolia TaxID=103349 RepID=A0AA39A4S0_VITRO|nr:hypothetical protein PVL29_006333 [Vitis rotundifolia]
MKHLGYKDCLGYYYANENEELVWCLTDQIVLEICNSLSNDREVDVFVKHPKVLHLPKTKIGVCEGEDSKNNGATTPNVDEVVDEIENSSSEGEFVDDEYSVSDDDDLYDNYVHANEEWVGVKSNEEKDKRVEEENIIVNDVKGEENLCDDDMRTLDSGSEEESNRFSVRLLFTSATELQVVVREYAIKNGRNVKFVKNEKDKVRVVCSIGCPWVVYAAQVRDEKTFQLRTYNVEHTCGRVFKNNNLTSRYLCKKHVDHFRNNPKLSSGAFMNTMRSSLACEVSPSQAYRTKKKTLKQIQGTHIEQYAKLSNDYVKIKRTNSSLIVIMKTKMVRDKGLVPTIEELLPT